MSEVIDAAWMLRQSKKAIQESEQRATDARRSFVLAKMQDAAGTGETACLIDINDAPLTVSDVAFFKGRGFGVTRSSVDGFDGWSFGWGDR